MGHLRKARRRITAWWIGRGWILLAILFLAATSFLMFRKHASFNTRTYDLARFDQAIWNTLHGRFLYSSIREMSILGNHFSPFMALLSPLFLIWNDVRVLFLVQTVSVAVTGLFLYRIVRIRRATLAPWFLLAFYLNPSVHETTLFEFRRVVLAMPFLAMALYALYTRRRGLMTIGLGLALLCKEDVGLVVFMVGLYLILFERDWKWGVPIVLIGVAWVIGVSLWVIPLFAGPQSDPDVYPQLYYFDFLGDSYSQIVANLRHDPLLLVRHVFEVERGRALLRAFLPLGLVLPFLAPGWALICVPTMAYLLISNEPRLYRFETWHLATVLPVLFAAVGVGLGRLSSRWARWATGLLLVTTIAGYVLYSPAPLGGTYEPALYDVTQHHRVAAKIIDAVPAEASVATLARYVPHLAHREHVYHYPWVVLGVENVDIILLDRYANPYPFTPDELNAEIDDMVADTRYVIDLEADGIYLFRQRGQPLSSFAVDAVADGTMRLERVEVAPSDEDGIYQTVSQAPVELQQGQEVRVSLYWEALAAPNAERTVSVRVADASGWLVAQHDSMPGHGTKPTSWWEKGWVIRDVYYLQVSPDAPPGPGRLDVLVYDSASGQVVPFGDGSQAITVAPVELKQGER
ncbi:MAG TPA: DUF2079 domain-containing protein [Anaerolineae bacterium]|nr:DUF2079 domain-containing protein [Anaerolineae bacterium]